jgi:hypothetical protein
MRLSKNATPASGRTAWPIDQRFPRIALQVPGARRHDARAGRQKGGEQQPDRIPSTVSLWNGVAYSMNQLGVAPDGARRMGLVAPHNNGAPHHY